MIGHINKLQYKVTEYQNTKTDNFTTNWPLLKQIILILADILETVAHDLPDSIKWLSGMFLLVSQLLKSLCSSLPDLENKEV